MHIPDGIMAPAVIAAGWVVTVVAVSLAVRRAGRGLDEDALPTVALFAAGIFVAQLLNFPVAGGTTGHLVGAALAAILLGPAASVVAFTVILVIQALLFGDGGLLALGLNLLNMGVIGSLSAWAVYRVLGGWNRRAAAFAAAWISVFLGAMMAAVELAISYSLSPGYGVPPLIAFSAMGFYHAFIATGEGILTVGILAYLARVAPELTRLRKPAGTEAVP